MNNHDHDHEHRPTDRQIWSRADWKRAITEGWLTRVDIENRLHNIAVHDFGQLGSAGYDEEGFISSLVADGVRVEDIGWFKVWPNDHDPPHVHVVPFGHDKQVDLRFSLETGELLDDLPACISRKDVKNMKRALVELNDQLGAWWAKGERGAVALAPMTD